MKLNAFILLSGGMDSTATLDFFLRNKYHVQCLFLDYGQLSNKNELIAVKNITAHYDVNYSVITVNNLPEYQDGFILGRNLFLVSHALMSFPFKNGTIAMGIHSDTSYIDCTQTFVNKTQELLDLYSDRQITFRVPFITWNKLDIWKYCELNKVPTSLSYSCELGEEQPCGHCISCKDIQKIDAFKSK